MMASPKMMMVSTTNSDLPRRESSVCSFSALMADHDNGGKQHSITMDDILKNMYDTTANDMDDSDPHRHQHQHQHQHPGEESSRSVDEMWKAIVAGGGVGPEMEEEGGGGDQLRAVAGEGAQQGMTLEDFLTRAGAVREEDVGPASASASAGGGIPIGYGQFQVPLPTAVNGGGGGGGGGRGGKRRAVQEAPPLDKATQQKQRRMIKNRESAARSRERKQAYTVELESLVTQLEEENARLVREEAEQKKERFKQLMENLIPIIEKRRPPRVLRRVHSVHW